MAPQEPQDLPRGIILQGPPASGKFAVAQELVVLDSRFRAASGSPVFIFAKEPDRVFPFPHGWVKAKDETWRVVDFRAVDFWAGGDGIPVIPVQDIDDLEVVRSYENYDWTTVHLWTPRDQAEQLLAIRMEKQGWGRPELLREMREWDRVVQAGTPETDLRFDTSRTLPEMVAERIRRNVLPESSD